MIPVVRQNMSAPRAELQLPASPATHPWRRRWLGPRDYWLCQAVGWGTFLACEAFTVLGLAKGGSSRAELSMMAAIAAGGLLVSHLLRIAILRQRRRPQDVWRLSLRLLPWIGAHAAAMCSFVFALVLLGVPGAYERSDFGPGGGWPEYLALLSMCFLLLAMWSALYFGILAYQHYQRARVERLQLAAAVREAELRALRSQVSPHFLFNCLNTLRALIPRELAGPRDAVTLLADFLRGSLTLGQRETVTLAEELALVDDYLALEQLRFESRLRVERSIAPQAGEWPIPPFLLQTLVENAVKYGVSPRERGGTITLVVRTEAERLHLAVGNPGWIATQGESTGLGIGNARARLLLLFGPTATLHLRQAAPDEVRAEVVIPRRRLAAAPQEPLPT